MINTPYRRAPWSVRPGTHRAPITSSKNASAINVTWTNFKQFCELFASGRLNAYIGRLNLRSHFLDDSFEGGSDNAFQFNEHLEYLAGLPNVKYLRLADCSEHLPSFFTAIAYNFSGVTELELSYVFLGSFTDFLQLLDTLPLLGRLALSATFYKAEAGLDLGAQAPVYPVHTVPGRLEAVCLGNYPVLPLLHWLHSQPCIRRLAIGKLNAQGSLYRQVQQALASDLLHTLEHLVIFAQSGYLDSHTTPPSTLSESPAYINAVSCVLERIVLVVILREKYELDSFDWPRIAVQLAEMEGLQRVEFSVADHETWAARVIDEKLGPRKYMIEVRKWDDWQSARRWDYGLEIFDA
ncbi:hypothetical protein FB451DRAFT_1538172 [Mycena latifolia]|nr:hypothetical protein FB451DRAFT_1538172 [Mycena latifolia]